MKKYSKIFVVLSAVLISVSVSAQDIVYKGKVVDVDNTPLIGASVRVPDTQNVTITDIDGNFSIKVQQGDAVEISYLGYVSQKISDFSQTIITMQEDAQALDEVVVVGYGVQKKAHLTGAIATVNMDDVKDITSGNLASSLNGLVNGLSISGGEGRPGESASISIRDAGSIKELGGSSQEPLFVIDGFIAPNGSTAFNNLDPADIESISVLKDAAAAVYGARAADGVIIVTTKRGKVGEPVISYSGTFGFTDEIARPKMLDAYQYGKLYNAVKAADPTNTTINKRLDLFQADELDAMKSLDYDLLDKYWKTSFMHKHNVSVNGATEKANYFASIGYFSQDGNVGRIDYDRWNYRAGIDVTVKKWFKVSAQVSGDYGGKASPYVKIGGENAEKEYNLLLWHPRYIPEEVNGHPMSAYGPSNTQVDRVQEYSFYTLQNNGDFSNTKTSNMTINASLEHDFGWWKPLKGLKARFSYAKNILTDKGNQYTSSYNIYKMNNRAGSGSHLYTPIPGQEAEYEALMDESNFELGNNGTIVYNGTGTSDVPMIRRTMSRSDSYQMNFSLTYNRDFGDHSIGALFSVEKSESELEDLQGQVTNPLSFGGLQSNAVGDQSTQTTVFTRSEAGMLSYIGRLNYAYKDKYLAEFLIRSDASTKFAPKNYWGTFPSLSFGWIMSQEDWFMDNVKWIDYLKLRVSFGMSGRDNTTAWAWMQTYGADKDKGPVFGTGNENNASGHLSMNNNNAAINPDAHWDKSYKSNFGLDLTVLDNRLSFNIDGYYNWEREMLIPYNASVPGIVGTASANQNIGKMNSYGVEFSATWRDRVSKDFNYKITLNTGYSDNEVLFMDFPTNQNDAYLQIYPGHRTDMGIWGMQCVGMFRSFQEIEEYFAANNITSYMGMTKDKVRPGMLIYKDIRGAKREDGTYAGPDGSVDTTYDKVCLSNRTDPYHVTANFSIDWKGLALSGLIGATWGGYDLVPSAALKPQYDLEFTNMPSFWNPDDMFVYEDIVDNMGNVVVPQNRNARFPNLAYASVNAEASTFWRISGARVTLNRLTLSYTLPAKIVKAVGIGSCRFNITGQNLLSFYNPYPDNFWDPMAGTYGNYPNLRKFTIGINVSF